MREHSSEIKIEFKGVELTVYYDYTPPYNSQDHMAENEPERFLATEIKLGKFDVGELVADYIDEIEAIALEKIKE